MTTHRLLVEDHQGQNFLLTTESCPKTKTNRLVVLQRIDDTWQPLTGIQAQTCRESVIGAFVDFVVDICRVLNSTGSESDRVSACTPMSRRSRIRASSQPKFRTVR
jgi:hypothetical protein